MIVELSMNEVLDLMKTFGREMARGLGSDPSKIKASWNKLQIEHTGVSIEFPDYIGDEGINVHKEEIAGPRN